MKIQIVEDDGSISDAGLYEICVWIVETYPEDVFLYDSNHPLNVMRNKAKEILGMKKK